MDSSNSLPERLGLTSGDIKQVIGNFNECFIRASRDWIKTKSVPDSEAWLDMDIEIVRLRLVILKSLKAQIADDTKQLFRLQVRRALNPLRCALYRLWQFAKMVFESVNLWVFR